jgi:hypothetical protein
MALAMMMRVFRTAIRLHPFFSVLSFPFNGIALSEDTFLQFSCSYGSASLASQDLKIEIYSARLLLRHGAVGGQL